MNKEEVLKQLPLLEEMEKILEEYERLTQEMMDELEKADPSHK